MTRSGRRHYSPAALCFAGSIGPASGDEEFYLEAGNNRAQAMVGLETEAVAFDPEAPAINRSKQ